MAHDASAFLDWIRMAWLKLSQPGEIAGGRLRLRSVYHRFTMQQPQDRSGRTQQAGGTLQSMDDAEIAIEHAEHKYRDPFGVVIDVSTRGWDGARRDV